MRESAAGSKHLTTYLVHRPIPTATSASKDHPQECDFSIYLDRLVCDYTEKPNL